MHPYDYFLNLAWLASKYFEQSSHWSRSSGNQYHFIQIAVKQTLAKVLSCAIKQLSEQCSIQSKEIKKLLQILAFINFQMRMRTHV